MIRRLVALLPSIIPLALGTLIAASPARFAERTRDLVFDEYQRLSPRPWSNDLPVRIIAIDEDSIASVGQWPWPRDKLAELTNALANLEPAAIGFDILFSEPDRLSLGAILRRLPASAERDTIERALTSNGGLSEDALAKAIARAPVILSETFLNEGGAPKSPDLKSNFVALGDDPTNIARHFSRASQPLPDLLSGAAGVGGVNFAPDRDLIIRRAPVIFSVGPLGASALAPSLAAEILRVAQIDPADHTQPSPSPLVKSTGASMQRNYGGSSAIISVRIGAFEIPTEADGQVRVRYAGHQPERFLSANSLLSGEVSKDQIAGHLVLIGVTAAGLGDIRSTPINGAIPGVEVHAELLEHAVTGASLERPDYARGVEALAALLGGAIAAWIASRFRPALSGVAIVAVVALAGLASWNSFARLSLLFDPILPAATWLATWGATTVAVYRRSENDRRFVRSAFSRYLAPAVVERIAADPSLLRLGGEAREISVLFSDARDFTARSENLSAEGVVAFLNGLLTPLTAAVLARQGAIDKYLGDGLMAYWNAPLDTPDHASLACQAALDMVARIPTIDREMRELARAEGRPHLRVAIGIGVNTGRAFVGNMGSEQRFDYSMVGDPVNVAARLEAATKEFDVPIIVSEETRRQARGFRFVPLGRVALKGRGGAAIVHALHGLENDVEPDFALFIAAHGRAVESLETGEDIDSAIAAAREFTQARRYEGVYRLLEARRGVIQPVGAKLAGGS